MSSEERTHNLLVESFTSGNHRVDVLGADETFHEDRSCVVVLEELLHHSWQFFKVGTS
jgi:hypothetical protein